MNEEENSVYILCPTQNTEEGLVYTIDTQLISVLLVFEEKDDAERYKEMLKMNGEDYDAVEIDKEMAIDLCEMQEYNYTIVSSDELVIPI